MNNTLPRVMKKKFLKKVIPKALGITFCALQAGGAAVIHGQLLNVPMVL